MTAYGTDDIHLDIFAAAWREAFHEAESNDPVIQIAARSDIVEFWGVKTVERLHRQGCITWTAATSTRQLMLL